MMNAGSIGLSFVRTIYLDPILISSAYEELRGVTPVTTITRTEDVEGSASIGFFRVGGAAREIREFKTSTLKMFFEIEPSLRGLQVAMGKDSERCLSPFWTKGFLSTGRFVEAGDKDEIKQVDFTFFCIADDGKNPSCWIRLLTQDSYFTSGYDIYALNKQKVGFRIWEPVEALLMPSCCDFHRKQRFCAPFVILKSLDNHPVS